MCPQKNSNGASLQDQGICPDCPLTKTGLKEVCRGLSDLSTMSNRCTTPACKHRKVGVPSDVVNSMLMLDRRHSHVMEKLLL